MPRIQIQNYSRFADMATGVQFNPVLDYRTHEYIGVAEVTDEQAQAFADRPAFKLLSEEEWSAISTPKARPAVASSGDPLSDGAQQVQDNAALTALAAQKMDALKEQAAPHGIVVRPGMSKVDVAGAILRAQASTQAGSEGGSESSAPNGASVPPPPAPPSSGE